MVAVVVLLIALMELAGMIRARVRTTPTFDPPVLAGQMVSGGTAGFYARRGDTIVLTISAHGYDLEQSPRDAAGRVIGRYGADARRAPCPSGRTCAGSDIRELILTPDHIPWGHLNQIDLGPGGYRTLAAQIKPLSCADLREGMPTEVNGRGIYRWGRILDVEPYAFEADTIFPCMALTDMSVGIGDSGGPVITDGVPAGITSRDFSGRLGFTSLAEGLEDLGLTLCTEPNCGLPPP